MSNFRKLIGDPVSESSSNTHLGYKKEKKKK
jgi:hypothetical protein